MKLVIQQYSAWSDFLDVQSGLAETVLVAKTNHFWFRQYIKGLTGIFSNCSFTILCKE